MRNTCSYCLLALCLAGIMGTNGCGYHLAGQGNALPVHLQKIAVPIFKNQTYEYGLENIVSQKVIDAFNRRSGVKVVKDPSEADAVLEGDITDYKYIPTLNSQREVTQYYINITASVRLRDLVKESIYWENKNFIFNEIYQVTEGLSSVDVNRQKAWEDAAEDFAESIANVLFEGF
ncbi:LptE family protein [bacterium]|nr:LptE family protein [candidate division CSSED10-310 bacterium]